MGEGDADRERFASRSTAFRSDAIASFGRGSEYVRARGPGFVFGMLASWPEGGVPWPKRQKDASDAERILEKIEPTSERCGASKTSISLTSWCLSWNFSTQSGVTSSLRGHSANGTGMRSRTLTASGRCVHADNGEGEEEGDNRASSDEGGVDVERRRDSSVSPSLKLLPWLSRSWDDS